MRRKEETLGGVQSILDKIKDLPDPAGATIIALGFLGVPVVLLTLLTIVHLCQAWIETGRKTAAVSRRIPGFFRRVAEMPRIRVMLVVVVSILAPAVQFLTLLTCFIVGTVLSWIFYHKQFHDTTMLFAKPAYYFGPTPSLSEVLKINYVSGAYVLLGGWTLLRSYRYAFNGKPLENAAFPLALPAYLCLYAAYALALFGSIPAIVGVIAGEWRDSLGGVVAAAGLALIGFLYIASCEAGVRSAGLLVRMWAPARSEQNAFDFESTFGHPLRRPWH